MVFGRNSRIPISLLPILWTTFPSIFHPCPPLVFRPKVRKIPRLQTTSKAKPLVPRSPPGSRSQQTRWEKRGEWLEWLGKLGEFGKIHENPLLLLILWLHVATCGYRDLGFEATERRNGLKSLVELSPIPTEISNCHVSGNRLWLGSNEFFNNYNY